MNRLRLHGGKAGEDIKNIVVAARGNLSEEEELVHFQWFGRGEAVRVGKNV